MVPALRPSPPLVTRFGLRLMALQLEDPHRCSSVSARVATPLLVGHIACMIYMGLHRVLRFQQKQHVDKSLPRLSELRVLSRPCPCWDLFAIRTCFHVRSILPIRELLGCYKMCTRAASAEAAG
ncbi:hypothetical protein HN011_004377 [Eciton burchellii]|nr:hypothetical protein HN011_004377 [Eciton burchellii]